MCEASSLSRSCGMESVTASARVRITASCGHR
jgi:hypothetical protein